MSDDSWVDQLSLIDHHTHLVTLADLTGTEIADRLSESGTGAPSGTSHWDSQLGFAVRRWCAEKLDLPPLCSPEDYVRRRADLGGRESSRRLLGGAAVEAMLVDDGPMADGLCTREELSDIAECETHRVLRLELFAEDLRQRVGEADYLDALQPELEAQLATAIAAKSIIAYRAGLEIRPQPPAASEVARAAREWFAQPTGRLTNPTLIHDLVWRTVEAAKPLQLHTGFGDPDVDLHRANPLLLSDFLRATASSGPPVMLLHCYPFQREAAYLAHAYPHVYMDVGLAIPFTGARADTVLAEALELAPFSKVLYSSDAYELAELHYLGAVLWRRALAGLLDGWVTSGDWGQEDAERVGSLIARDNALRAYGLGDRQ